MTSHSPAKSSVLHSAKTTVSSACCQPVKKCCPTFGSASVCPERLTQQSVFERHGMLCALSPCCHGVCLWCACAKACVKGTSKTLEELERLLKDHPEESAFTNREPAPEEVTDSADGNKSACRMTGSPACLAAPQRRFRVWQPAWESTVLALYNCCASTRGLITEHVRGTPKESRLVQARLQRMSG